MRVVAKHVLGDRSPIELENAGWIIGFGEGYGQLHVVTGPSGKIEVRSLTGCTIILEPRAANSVWVSANI